MAWWVSNQGEVSGPLDADAIRQAVTDGRITGGMHVRDDGGQWTPIESSPFAAALQAKAKASSQRSQLASAFALLSFVGLGLFFLLRGCGAAPTSTKELMSKAGSPKPEPVPVAEAKREPTPQERLSKTDKLSEAIAIVRPFMEDTTGGDMPIAAASLGLWASGNLRWSDLEAMPDSRRAAVMKDPDTYRGELLCASGTIIEIQADRSVTPPVWQGGIMTQSFDMVRFLAVRSTGDLVKDDIARFCGIVTGLQSYPNVSGGTTHAVYVVGMFDLPENKVGLGQTVRSVEGL